VVYTALSEELEGKGGTMISNCRIIKHYPEAVDPKIQKRLWEVSTNLTKLHRIKNKEAVYLNTSSLSVVSIV
jgi:hypothetical protein